ncbi:hypothetical protein Taro_009556, partial [Colocasia esculenta]|nr:hypothetical protein [Colocasia esculenta]
MAAGWHGGIATTRARPLLPTAPRTPVAAAAAAEGTRGKGVAMSSSAAKVAVVGCGISGASCASMLAGRGLSVTVFESGRGPGGRMSQRRFPPFPSSLPLFVPFFTCCSRLCGIFLGKSWNARLRDKFGRLLIVVELAEGEELLFDHGAPFFSTSNEEVMNIVKSWEEMGLVSEWKENFGCFDMKSSNFVDFEKDGSSKKYVGVPGMNSICKALCREPGVETKFETSVGKLNWRDGRNLWLLSGMGSENLGHFDSVVVSDKNVFSPRSSGLTGRPPPLEISLIPELAGRLQDIPVQSSFALMLAFSEPLSLVSVLVCVRYANDKLLSDIPVKGFAFKNSNVLNWAFCDSSKPGRLLSSSISERWVLHSTAEYAASVISKTGLKKPSTSTLVEVAGELLQEFERTGLVTSRPFFMKAHR